MSEVLGGVITLLVSCLGPLYLNRSQNAVTIEIGQIGETRDQQIKDLRSATDEARKRAEEAEKIVARLRADLVRHVKRQKLVVWAVFGLLIAVCLASHIILHHLAVPL